MINWRQIPSWLFKIWPLWGLWLVILLRPVVETVGVCISPTTPMDKIFSFLLQVLGGMLVLYATNDNLRLFKRQSICSSIVEWCKSFPRSTPQSIRVASQITSCYGIVGTPRVSHKKTEMTLEQRVELLEAKRETSQQDTEKQFQNLYENTRKEIEKCTNSVADQIGELGKKIEHVVVGGVKLHIFGAFLVFYGAMINVSS